MIQLFLLKFWKEILLSVLVAGGSFFVYEKIKHIGYVEAETKYELVIKGYQDQIATQITNIEDKSNTLVSGNRDSAVILKSGIDEILRTLKNKPMVIVKNGECTPSQTFSDSFGQLNTNANKIMKDSRK
jgi:urocanate hydratase